MYFREIFRLLGYYFFAFTLSLIVPLAVAIYFEAIAPPEAHPQAHSTLPFLFTIAISFAFGAFCYKLGKKASGHFFRREGLLSVVMIWLLTPAIAALPFYLSNTSKDPFQAYFEMCSGFTTTGVTVMQAKNFDPQTGKEIPITKSICGELTTNYTYYGTIDPIRDPQSGKVLYEGIEAVSKGLLFWRSFTQWLGGGGIIVLFVAILPALGVGGKMLFQTEVPGPVKDSLTPRIKETASHLWKIYVGMSLMQFLILLLVNPELDWFDASTITFATVSTGGLCIKNASIGGYANPATDWVCIVFMVMGGVNFSLYFHALKGKFYRIYEPEFILYLLAILVVSLSASYLIVGTPQILMTGLEAGMYGGWDAIRNGFFIVVSILTTTGFSTVDYDVWPYAAQVLLLIVMYVGGMSGSTSGGIKIMRILMLFRIAQYKVESVFRPEAVRRFRIGQLEVDSGASIMVLTFFLIVVAVSAFGTLVFIETGLDPESAFSLVALLINNVGMGFRMAAATDSAAFLSDFGLFFSSLLMILGRLEYVAILAILVPAFWRQTS
jgi:trk system potassium uptake protein TrkH